MQALSMQLNDTPSPCSSLGVQTDNSYHPLTTSPGGYGEADVTYSDPFLPLDPWSPDDQIQKPSPPPILGTLVEINSNTPSPDVALPSVDGGIGENDPDTWWLEVKGLYPSTSPMPDIWADVPGGYGSKKFS
jgi:hypothetical protein